MKNPPQPITIKFLALLGLLGACLLSINVHVISFEFSPTETPYIQNQPAPFPWLYQKLIQLMHTHIDTPLIAARLPSVLFGGACIAIVYYLSFAMFHSHRSASLAGLILLSSKFFFRGARTAHPDMASLFFILIAFTILYQTEKKGWLFYTTLSVGFLLGGLKAVLIPLIFLLTLAVQDQKSYKPILIHPGIILPIMTISTTIFYLDYLSYLTLNHELNLIDDEHNRLSILLHNFWHSFQKCWVGLDPWIFLGVPALFSMFKSKLEKPQSFLITWMLCIFLTCSIIMKLKPRYILLITPALAIFLGHHFTLFIDTRSILGKIDWFSRKIIPIVLITMGFFLVVFISFFLLNTPKSNIVIYIGLFVLCLTIIKKYSYPEIPPSLLGILVFFLLTQSPLMVKAGLIPYSTIQSLAQEIKNEITPNDLVVSGSHDLPRSTIQSFFDQEVHRGGESYEDGTHYWLNYYFIKKEAVYCFILTDNYEKYLKAVPDNKLKVLAREKIMRKSLHLDMGFLRALLTLNKKGVQDYLLHEILLIKKSEGIQVSIKKIRD